MTTADDFLPAILAAPDDDTPRLALADWLEEQGDPASTARSEFIRVQCRLAELRPGPEEHRKASRLLERRRKGSPVRMKAQTPATLLMREAVLLGNVTLNGGVREPCQHCDWHAPIPHGGWAWEFRRGFVESVTLSCADWLAHGPALVRRQPVQEVRLNDREPIESAYGWRWFEDLDTTRRGQPPMRIWRVAIEFGPWLDDLREPFLTRAAAIDALSTAALLWARAAEPVPTPKVSR
jgi:uncharacterized protein (TIGR02996 family)